MPLLRVGDYPSKPQQWTKGWRDEKAMDAFELSQLVEQRRQSGERHLEFFRSSTLSTGIYELAAGATDPQQPHTKDEIYYIVSGRAEIRVGDEDRPVGPGTVIFVEAKLAHRFHSITEDLKILVVFAPPRGSGA